MCALCYGSAVVKDRRQLMVPELIRFCCCFVCSGMQIIMLNMNEVLDMQPVRVIMSAFNVIRGETETTKDTK